jgi:hypothetical protein
MTRVTIPSAGQYGVIGDAAPQELPPNAWSAATNMRFRDGYAERFKGSAAVFDAPAVVPYFVAPFAAGTARMWIHAGLARVYVDDGTTRTDLTPASPYTGAIDDKWTGGTLGGISIINNGVDLPQYWGGNIANKFAALTAWTSTWRAVSVRPFKNFLVALGITWSSGRQPPTPARCRHRGTRPTPPRTLASKILPRRPTCWSTSWRSAT